jgi:hypothetical protein
LCAWFTADAEPEVPLNEWEWFALAVAVVPEWEWSPAPLMLMFVPTVSAHMS